MQGFLNCRQKASFCLSSIPKRTIFQARDIEKPFDSGQNKTNAIDINNEALKQKYVERKAELRQAMDKNRGAYPAAVQSAEAVLSKSEENLSKEEQTAELEKIKKILDYFNEYGELDDKRRLIARYCEEMYATAQGDIQRAYEDFLAKHNSTLSPEASLKLKDMMETSKSDLKKQIDEQNSLADEVKVNFLDYKKNPGIIDTSHAQLDIILKKVELGPARLGNTSDFAKKIAGITTSFESNADKLVVEDHVRFSYTAGKYIEGEQFSALSFIKEWEDRENDPSHKKGASSEIGAKGFDEKRKAINQLAQNAQNGISALSDGRGNERDVARRSSILTKFKAELEKVVALNNNKN